MSELITIAKNRKTGRWEILAGPDDSFDIHNRIYQKMAANLPVSDEYEKLIPTRIQPFLTRRTFITSEENQARLEAQADLSKRAIAAGEDAEIRQKKLDDERAAQVAERHGTELDQKNALVNQIRKATGQPPLDPTKTEVAAEQLATRLQQEDRKRLSDVLRVLQGRAQAAQQAIQEVPKTNADILAEKNALVEKAKQQAAENLQQQEQAQADKQARVETKKNPSAKT
jgi:hypothetical protein